MDWLYFADDLVGHDIKEKLAKSRSNSLRIRYLETMFEVGLTEKKEKGA